MAGGGTGLEMFPPLDPRSSAAGSTSENLLVTGKELRSMHTLSMRIVHGVFRLAGMEPAFEDSKEYILDPNSDRYQSIDVVLAELNNLPETDPAINNN